MKNIVLASLLTLSSIIPAFAQSEGFRSRIDGVYIRNSVSCHLRVEGVVNFNGLCNVGRQGKMSVIEVDGLTFVIKRDNNTDYEADLFLMKNDNLTRLESISAHGHCWVGEITKFCAN